MSLVNLFNVHLSPRKSSSCLKGYGGLLLLFFITPPLAGSYLLLLSFSSLKVASCLKGIGG
jgi:hypothetical protein